MVRPPTSLLAVALLCCMSVHGAPAMAPAINVSDSNLTDAIATDAYAANATFNATATIIAHTAHLHHEIATHAQPH